MMRSAGAIALLAALTALTVSLLVGGGVTAAGPCEGEQLSDAWRTVAKPLDSITAFAAGGADGKLLLATDGKTVMRSSDDGCSWSKSYEVQGGTGVDGLPKIVQLLLGENGGPALLVLDGLANTAGSSVLISANGGQNWAPTTGVPALGGVRFVRAAGDQETRYLVASLAEVAGTDLAAVYRSVDGGATWGKMSDTQPLVDLEVDPIAPSRLYGVRASNQVVTSSDGGQTFAVLSAPTAPWRDVAVAHRANEGATVAVVASASADADASAVAISTNSGEAWRSISNEGLGPPSGIMFGNAPEQLYVAAASTSASFHGPGLWAYEPAGNRWTVVDDAFGGLESLRDGVGAPAADSQRSLWFRRDHPSAEEPDLLARYEPPPAAGRLVPDLNQKKCQERPPPTPAPPKAKPATFAAPAFELKLTPGVASEQALGVTVPPTATPLDVYFLVDTSNSMDNAIDGVFCGIERIQRDLAAKHGDAWFGMGAFNDTQDYRYKRIVDVQPPGAAIHDALKNLFTRRGKDEPLRTPLFQTATGAGVYHRNANEENPSAEPDVIVPPGQQANFRDGSVRIVPLIADDPYVDNQPDEPLREEVVAALRQENILVIGLPVARVDEKTAPVDKVQRIQLEARLRAQLDYFGRETGSVAPAGGIDCDGNGTVDVAQGQAIICPIPNGRLGGEVDDTILTIVRALKDIREVKVVPSKTAGLIMQVRDAKASLDLKKGGALSGAGSIECTPAQVGHKFEVAFDAVIGRRVLATFPGVVTCGELAALPVLPIRTPREKPAKKPTPAAVPDPPPADPVAAVPPPPPPPGPQPVPVVAPQPPPPSPAPVNAPAPSTSSAAQSSASSAVSPTPQTGMASQQVTRPQAQTAKIRSDEHAMVASKPTAFIRAHRRASARAMPVRDEIQHHPALLTLGIGACSAFGYVMVASARTRRRFREAQARYGGR